MSKTYPPFQIKIFETAVFRWINYNSFSIFWLVKKFEPLTYLHCKMTWFRWNFRKMWWILKTDLLKRFGLHDKQLCTRFKTELKIHFWNIKFLLDFQNWGSLEWICSRNEHFRFYFETTFPSSKYELIISPSSRENFEPSSHSEAKILLLVVVFMHLNLVRVLRTRSFKNCPSTMSGNYSATVFFCLISDSNTNNVE